MAGIQIASFLLKKNADEASEARPENNHEVQEFAGTVL